MDVNTRSHKIMERRASRIKTETRREQIAHAALAVIAQHGLNYLNIATLATELGVVPSAIYRHFPSKDDVLKSVLELIAKRLQANVIAVCQATPDPLEQLHLLLQRHVHLAYHNAGIPRVLFSEQIFAGDAGRRTVVDQTFRGYLGKISSIIGTGQRQGHIRTTISPEVAAVMFLGLIQPAIILQLMSAGSFDAAKQAESAWKLFREMLQVSNSCPLILTEGKNAPDELKANLTRPAIRL